MSRRKRTVTQSLICCWGSRSRLEVLRVRDEVPSPELAMQWVPFTLPAHAGQASRRASALYSVFSMHAHKQVTWKLVEDLSIGMFFRANKS